MLVFKYYALVQILFLFFLFLRIDCSSHYIQVKPPCSFTPKEIDYLTDRIQNGGTEVVEVQIYMFDLLLENISCAVFFFILCGLT